MIDIHTYGIVRCPGCGQLIPDHVTGYQNGHSCRPKKRPIKKDFIDKLSNWK